MYKIIKAIQNFIRKYPKVNRSIDFFWRITEGSPLVYRCRDYTSSNIARLLAMIVSLPFCLARYFFPPKTDIPGREGLAAVLIAKNEAPYIEEWINFHRRQGVSHFIIYDNESTDNFPEILKPYIDSGLVTYHLIKGKMRQKDAYNMAIHDYRRKFKYIAVIDADEFLFLRGDNCGGGGLYGFVDGFMREHSNAGGLAVNWLIFGSSGHITKPEGGVLENYTKCAEDSFFRNRLIKTICDPMKVLSFGSVHYPVYFRGFSNLSENGMPVNDIRSETPRFEHIRINHYFTKSLEEYTAKMNRGKADLLEKAKMRDFTRSDRNERTDTEILSHM